MKKDRIAALEKELAKVKKELAKYRAFMDEVSRPTDLYLRELARECAGGNWQALKDHNKRVSHRRNEGDRDDLV